MFQKQEVYQPFSFFEDQKHENLAVECNAQTDDNCDEEVSRMWDVKFGSTNESFVADDDNKMSSTLESPTCFSFTSDLSCDSLTQGSLLGVNTNTKDPSEMVLQSDVISPKSDSVSQSWQNTMVCTSQQQIIDCVVDQMCFTGSSKIHSDWLKSELPYQPMNNNVYESIDDPKASSECCNPSGKASSPKNTISSQNQNVTELKLNQSEGNISTEDFTHLLSDKSEFIIVNDLDDPQCLGIIPQSQEDSNVVENNNNIPETALLLEVKSEPLREDLVPQLQEEGYEIQVLNAEENSSEAHLGYTSLEVMETVDSQTEEGNIVFVLKSENMESEDVPEISNERLSPSTDKKGLSSSKPARACKGVRYREFMSNSQLGKRRARQKQRSVQALLPFHLVIRKHIISSFSMNNIDVFFIS